MIVVAALLRRLFSVVCLTASVAASAQTTPTQQQSVALGVFGHLLGKWSITGSTLGKPTITGAQVRAEFDGAFVEMHITDPAGKDPYEARVFVGQKQDGHLVIHWLDKTGAETSQTLGTGKVSEDVVTMNFPYPEAEFRDTLTYDPANDRWHLFIQMGPVAHPKVFSDWYFVRSNR